MLSIFKKKKAEGGSFFREGQDEGEQREVGGLRSFKRYGKDDTMSSKVEKEKGLTGVFKYVANVAPSMFNKDRTIAKLTNMNTNVRTKDVVIDNIPQLVLRSWKTSIPVTELFQKDWFKVYPEWVTVSEVYFNFVPSIDIQSAGGDVYFRIYDFRRRGDKMIKEVKAQTNVAVGAMAGNGFAVHKTDIDQLILAIECSNNVIVEGRVWGAVTISINLTLSDKALISSNEPTIGILNLPETFLKKERINPNRVDLTMNEEAVDGIRDMAAKGRIYNPDLPPTEQRKVTYAASEVGSSNPPSIRDEPGPSKAVRRPDPRGQLFEEHVRRIPAVKERKRDSVRDYVNSYGSHGEYIDPNEPTPRPPALLIAAPVPYQEITTPIPNSPIQSSLFTGDITSVDARISEARSNVFATGAAPIYSKESKATEDSRIKHDIDRRSDANIDAAAPGEVIEYAAPNPSTKAGLNARFKGKGKDFSVEVVTENPLYEDFDLNA